MTKKEKAEIIEVTEYWCSKCDMEIAHDEYEKCPECHVEFSK